MKPNDSLDFIPKVTIQKKKYSWWLLVLIIPAILVLSFAIWTKLDCPGINKIMGLPDPSTPNFPMSSNAPKIQTSIQKFPEPQGTKIVSGVMTDFQYDGSEDILYLNVKTSDNTIWLIKHSTVSHIINQEDSRSFMLSTRHAEAWIKHWKSRGIAVTVGIKNGKVEDVIMLVPLD